jgi:GNAT superfamily N-acetyltransferase
MTFAIRPLRSDERAAWEPLWQGYLGFYHTAQAPEVTDATWRRLHDPAEPMHAFVAEREGALLGLVHFIYHRSTWTLGPYCYLQDLFTADAGRGQGVGTALIEAVYAQARTDGASRVYWLTHETNEVARSLYDKLATRTGFIQYRQLLSAGERVRRPPAASSLFELMAVVVL